MELDALSRGVAEQLQARDKKIDENIQRIWDNQNELKGGLDVAEFHLRAYRRLLADICNQLYNEGEVVLLELPNVLSQFRKDEDGKPLPARVVHMRHYFALAHAEIKEVAEAEKRMREDQTIQKAVLKVHGTSSVEAIIDVRDRVAQGEKILKDEQGKEIELDDRMRAFAVQLLGNVIELKTTPPAPEVPVDIEKAVASDDGVPDGAIIFGGDTSGTPESDQGNEGHEEAAGEAAGRGEEDRPPSSLPEDAVPEVQTGDGGSQAEQ